MTSDQTTAGLARLWRPVVAVTAAAVGTPGVLALLGALIARQPGMGTGDVFALAGALLAGTFGGSTSFTGAMMLSGHLAAVPLTFTIATLVATAWAFRRTTARIGSSAEGVLVAGAAAVVSALVILVLAAVAGSGHAEGAGRVSGALFQGGAAGAFFGALALVLLVSVGMVLWHRDWLPTGLRVVGDLVRPLLAGAAVLVVALPLVGLVTGLAGGLSAQHTSDLTLHGAQARAGAVGAVAFCSNLGVWSLALGAGGRVGVSGFDQILGMATTFLHLDVPGPARLGWYAGDGLHQPGLWVAVVLTPLTLALAAYAALRAAGLRPWTGLGVWVAGQLVVVALLVRAADPHLSAQALGIDATGGFGALSWEAALLLAAYAGIIGSVGVLLARRRLDGAQPRNTTSKSARAARAGYRY